MKTQIALLAGSLLLCGLAGPSRAADNAVARGLNRFSASIYEELAKGGEGNLVLSPFSISSALSMALAGARGQTAAEMSKVLGQANADPKYHAELAALAEQIATAANAGGNQLLNANGLWVQKDFGILPGFRDTLQNVYHAPPSQVNFRTDLERSRAEINAWTERHTQGKIRDLFGPGSLDGSTRLVLASAVYFLGKWERPFRRAETHPAPFTLPGGGTEQADFMNQTGRFGYAATAGGQILEMRYAGTGLVFDILLPEKGAPLDSLDAGMNPERLAGWLGAIEDRTVQVAVPKFRVESEFPLVPVLARLGMPSAFSGAADFSGMDDKRDLRLSRVIHKAYVDVSEEGTEAAAATGAAMALVATRTPPPVFRADRPFLFLIRDTRTGLILFTGRLTDPKRTAG
jgi:serpin B